MEVATKLRDLPDGVKPTDGDRDVPCATPLSPLRFRQKSRWNSASTPFSPQLGVASSLRSSSSRDGEEGRKNGDQQRSQVRRDFGGARSADGTRVPPVPSRAARQPELLRGLRQAASYPL